MKKALTLLVGDIKMSPSAPLTMPAFRRPLKKLTERELLKLESEIGAQLFGPIPQGHSRSFFCLDAHTWIWHETWKDEKNVTQQLTVRYEVHEKGILKVLEGPRYEFIEGEELQNLYMATRLYYERVAREVYNIDPTTGYALSTS